MMSETDLDRLLRAARANPPVPGADLMARVLQDALDAQPRYAAPGPVTVTMAAPRRGLWDRVACAFGGRGVLAGLGCAAVLGLLAGYSQPTTLNWLTDGLPFADATGLELVPTAEFFLSEG
jgi:hypothetical protein